MRKPTEPETLQSRSGQRQRPRVLICEDSVLIQEAIRAVVEPTCEIVGLVEDGRLAIEMISVEQPDVVLVDISLQGVSGFVVAETVAARFPRTRVVFVTGYAEKAYVARAFELGVSGYVLKGSIRTDLLPAIQAASDGGCFQSALLA